jgi:rhodanese-related sulfurtransferase
MNTKFIFILIVIIIGVGGFVLYSDSNNEAEEIENHSTDEIVEEYEIYPGDVAQKIEDGDDIILLDVRMPEEYAGVHLKNALLLPVQNLSQETLSSIGLGESAKDKEIIIYCRSGARSKTAYDIMKSLGYTNIKSVAGGMIHWQEDNYPFTETGEYKGIKFDTVSQEEITGPKIAFDRTLHDFGSIPQFGGTVETVFTVKNKGSKTLEIGKITTSCSCTSASISSLSILPRGQAELTVVFDPDFHEEPTDIFKRTVFIPTNDPNNPEAEVVVQVDIEEGK